MKNANGSPVVRWMLFVAVASTLGAVAVLVGGVLLIGSLLGGCTANVAHDPALRCAPVCERFEEPGCPEHLSRRCEEGCLALAEATPCAPELDAMLACQETWGCVDMATHCRDERSALTGCENDAYAAGL